MSPKVVEIDVDELDCRFALVDSVFGKCLDDFKMRCPLELKQDFAEKAAMEGQSAAWRAKFWMALDVYGVEHVTSLIAQSLPMGGAAAHAYASTLVATMVSTLTQRAQPQQAVLARRATDKATG